MKNLDSIEQKIPILKMIANSNYVVIVLVVGYGCEEDTPVIQMDLEQHIKELNLPVNAYTICYTEDNMPFPEPILDAVYYFTPGGDKPVIKRHGRDAVRNLQADVDLAYKFASGMTAEEFMGEHQVELDKKTQEMFEEERKKEQKYPTKFKMARNIAKEMWKTAKRASQALPVLVDADTAKERLDLCMDCEHLTDETRCTECGCFMNAKVNLASAECPIGKWNAMSDES